MKILSILFAATLVVACGNAPREEQPLPAADVFSEVPLFEYEVGHMHRAHYPYEDGYPDTSFRGLVMLEDTEAELTVDSYDLTTAHVLWADTWREYWSSHEGEGPITADELASCLQSGAIYVPKDDATFNELCGGDLSRVACYHAPEAFELSVGYVQVIRWDWYRAIGNPELTSEYIHIVTHEIGHHVAKCAYGDQDNHHENNTVFEALHESVTERFLRYYLSQ